MNKLIYGKDLTENIVGVIPHDDFSVMVYFREDGTIKQYVKPSWSFFLTNEDGEAEVRKHHAPEWKRDGHVVRKLEDHAHGVYNRVIMSKSRKNNRALQKELSKEGIPYLTVGSAATQYMLQTGQTLFKGMDMTQIRRMQIDIETLSFDGKFPNAEDPTNEIFIISVSDNHGYRKVLHTGKPGTMEDETYIRFPDEKSMLIELVRIILMRDPDVIEGHNFFGFDMPYLVKRYKMHEVAFTIGRNRKAPRVFPGRKAKFADQEVEYDAWSIEGRAIVDTFFLVKAFDVYKRAMPAHTLKASAEFFGVAPEDRVYIDGDKLTPTWYKDPNAVLKYALDDGDETRALSDILLPSTFAMCKMVPNTLQAIHTGGTGRCIELLFMRHYLTHRTAIPKAEGGKQSFGGLTSMLKKGRIEALYYIDVASLYPSIMLNYNVKPDKDALNFFPDALKLLTDLRLDTKGRMNEEFEKNGESDLYRALDAEQAAYKIQINSFYGYLGYQKAIWNDISEADRVAITGQVILVRMMRLAEKFGCEIVEADTDGILCTMPEGLGPEDGKAFVKKLEDKMPEGIKLDLDGVYAVMLSYAAKNYALMDYKGKIKIKGGAFKSRSIELFIRNWMKGAIGMLLKGEWQQIKESFDAVLQRLFLKEMMLDEFRVKKNLKKDLGDYKYEVKHGQTNPAAQYEIWRRNPDKYGVGDPVFFWVAAHNRRRKGVKVSLDARSIEDYQVGKESTEWYIDRFIKATEKFAGFFDEDSAKILFDRNKQRTQTSLFVTQPNYDKIVTPIEQVKTVDELEKEQQANQRKYASLY